MTKEEMETIIQQAGWTLHLRKRYKQQYLYVARREGKTVREVYLAPVSKALAMSPTELTDLLSLKTASVK